MWRSWIGVAILWFAVTSVAGAQQSAEDEVARNLFQAGRTAYDAGNYDDALKYFEDSHNRSHRPQLLYNIGQAADRLRDDQKALSSFRAYLAAVPDAANRVEVENRIRALERPRTSDAVVTPVPAPVPVPAPTPTETAQVATPMPSTAPVSSAPPAAIATDDTPITGQWWFWTAIGGGVAAVVITAIALSSGDTTQPPLDSNTGVTVMALGGGR